MATTEHFRNGGGTSFSFVFPILANSDLKVEIYNASTGVWDLKTENTSGQTDNDYTISNTNVVFNSATPSGTGNVHIYRNTNVDNPAAVFAAGSSIRAVDLNDNQTQVLYSTQETSAQLVRETDLKDSIVTSAKIADGTIVDADINTSANIQGSKLLNDSVALTKLGSGALPTDITVASANIVNGTIVDADIATGTLDNRYYTETELDAGQLDNRYYTETELNAGQLDNRYYTETELTNGQLDGRYYTETELLNGALDGRYFTETEAEANFLRQNSSETIASGVSWNSSDSYVATSAAIDARIVDLVDDVGGFVPITNELNFPNTNPDVNNGAGTLVSIQALSQNLTSNGSGQISISNGTVGNSTVTITGAANSTTYAATFGLIVETTSTLNTYTFHRLVPKATEVTTVAGSISGVNTVAGAISNVNAVAGNATNINSAVSNASNINSAVSNASNINTVAGISGNVTTVAGISSDVTTVANDGTDIGNVSGSIANVNTTAGSISNVNTVAGNISNVNTVAGNNSNVSTVAGISGNVTTVAGISSNVTTVANDGTDIGLVAGSIANVNTTAGSIANVDTTAGSIANVNTVATNITNVNNASTYLNNFLSLYLGELASDPVTDALGNAINEGDLYWNNVTKQLRLYNGSVWQGINDNALELLKIATSGFSAVYTASAGSNNIDLGGLAISGAAFSNESFAPTRMSLAKGSATYNLGGI